MKPDQSTAEAQLRSMIDHAPVAVAMFDQHMRYIAVSARWLKDYRIDCPVLGRSHYEIQPDLPERWKDLHRNPPGPTATVKDASAPIPIDQALLYRSATPSLSSQLSHQVLHSQNGRAQLSAIG